MRCSVWLLLPCLLTYTLVLVSKLQMSLQVLAAWLQVTFSPRSMYFAATYSPETLLQCGSKQASGGKGEMNGECKQLRSVIFHEALTLNACVLPCASTAWPHQNCRFQALWWTGMGSRAGSQTYCSNLRCSNYWKRPDLEIDTHAAWPMFRSTATNAGCVRRTLQMAFEWMHPRGAWSEES